MTTLSDAALDRLREVVDWPDLTETRYELLAAVGRGGMGTVYRARDLQLGREVALKVIETGAEPELETRLLTEARVIASLEHPGIVPIHDSGRLPDGRLFYAMKLVAGRRLDELATAGLTLSAALSIFERLADAVAFAHSRGVVHRDLKPENVMAGAFGEVLVMDWGIAKLLTAPDREGPPPAAGALAPSTGHGTVLGTPGYMAPEQASGEPGRVDARTDVWALGAMLRYLLARTNDASAAARPLGAIAAKAMSESPEERYAGAADMAADVARFRSGLAVGAYRERLGERLLRVFRRHRTPILLVIAYLVMRVIIALAFK